MNKPVVEPLRPAPRPLPAWAQGPAERRRPSRRLLRLYPRSGWPCYIATALLGVLFATLLGLLFDSAGFEPVSNIRGRPAYLLVSIFIAPAIETAAFLSLPAFLIALLSRERWIRDLGLYLLVPVFAACHLASGLYIATLALFLGAAFATVYIRAPHSPFKAAACTHGLFNLFSALLHHLNP